MNGLDLIKLTEEDTIFGFPTGTLFIEVTTEEHAELKKRLMVLDIIIEKKVDIYEDICESDNFDEYVDNFTYQHKCCGKWNGKKLLTKDEFNLLAEVSQWTSGKKKK